LCLRRDRAGCPECGLTDSAIRSVTEAIMACVIIREEQIRRKPKIRWRIVTIVGTRSRSIIYKPPTDGFSVYLLHFAGFQTTGAYAHGLDAALIHHLCGLQIRLPASFCLVVRMANIVADDGLFPAYSTNPCHLGHLQAYLYFSNILCYTLPTILIK
jgi:hypothetical protein